MLVEALEVETVSSSLKQPKNSTGEKKLPVDTSDNFYLLNFHVLEKKKMPKENVNASKIQRFSFKNLLQFVLWLKNQNGQWTLKINKIFTALTVDSIMQAITKS